MSFLSTASALVRDPRVTLVGVAAMAGAIVFATVQVLAAIRDIAEVKPVPPKTQYITQDTEDALGDDTLDKLLQHPNDSIRTVATKILCDRVINDDAHLDYVLWGITRPDYEMRTKSLRALDFLVQQNSFDTILKLHTYKAYSALVRSLEHALKDRPISKLNDDYWDEYPLRDVSEKMPLYFISEMVNKYGVDKLVQSKFVKKWLKQQPWGDEDWERQKNFRHYVNTKPNNRIVSIITRLRESPRGYKALQNAGLVPTYPPANTQPRRATPGEGDGDGDGGSTTGGENNPPGARPRTREHSAEEQRLRRQHREAMVLNDGTRPLGRGDIIERGEV